MGQKIAPLTDTEFDRAKALCAAAIAAKGGLGVTVNCSKMSAAMHLRQLVYRARQRIRRDNRDSSDSVCTVDMRIIPKSDGTYDLKIFPPGQYITDLHLVDSATGKPVELSDNSATTTSVDTIQDWIAGILKETLAAPIRRADLSVRDAYLLDWEELAQLLYESGIRATKEPKFYSDPSPPPLTQERHR